MTLDVLVPNDTSVISKKYLLLNMENSIEKNTIVKDEAYYNNEVEYFEQMMNAMQLAYGMFKVQRDYNLSQLKQFAPAREEIIE